MALRFQNGLLRRMVGVGEIPVPPHAFGLGPERLSYAAFSNGNGRRVLTHEVEVPVSSSWFGEGVLGGPLSDEAAFATALETLIGKLVEAPRQASLVLPGEWLRTTYVEVDHRPKKRAELDEVVKWKLRQVVPFRIDDVRLSYRQVAASAGSDGHRFLVGFVIDRFVAQLESAFAAHDIRLGAVLPLALTLLDALPDGDGSLLWASDAAVSLVARRGGEPVLLRYKRLRSSSAETRERTVRSDLRLTRSWVDENADGDIGELRLAVPTEDSERFAAWCRADLGARNVASLDLSSQGLPAGSEWRLAPLLGAASRKVA